MRDIFLDTATQIARHWHCESEQAVVRKQLGERGLYCSHYVKCQYKATLLRSLIYLYNLLIHFSDLNKALREAAFYDNRKIAGGSLTQGVQTRINEIGHWMLEYRTYEEQILRIEDLIEDGWETMFHAGLKEPLVDETACLYAEGAPKKSEIGPYEPIEPSCTQKDPKACKIEEFWEKHRVHLEALARVDGNSVVTDDKKEVAKIKEHAEKIIYKNSPHGRRCTVHLSDAIICLESTHCPEPVAVHSINRKHFKVLGAILGIPCEP